VANLPGPRKMDMYSIGIALAFPHCILAFYFQLDPVALCIQVRGQSVYRGRNTRYRAPPAQIPAGAIRAPGSHLG